jgi:glycosyltransferase involved in cell wall biosynthesis
MEQIVSFMVRVSCMTYNQASYIDDTMNGFCIQETKFPFVCTIFDDNSTDGEQEVIRYYLETNFNVNDSSVARFEETDDYKFVFAQHKTNHNCFFAVYFLKYNHYRIKKSKTSYIDKWCHSQYIALCEGDDYWIHPQKLEKQVEFMSNHPNHSLVFCSHKRVYPNGAEQVVKRYEDDLLECPLSDMIRGGGSFMATNTMLFREVFYETPSIWTKNVSFGDLQLMLSLAVQGKVAFLSDVMCCYRVSSAGSWTESMMSDIRNRRVIYKQIETIWSQFDVWTKEEYHSLIREQIRSNRINRIKDELLTLFRRIK